MKKNFKIIGSAHNLREIIVKVNQSCSEIFVSPIFKTYKDNLEILGYIKYNKPKKKKYHSKKNRL